jgi:hypothetical protein
MEGTTTAKTSAKTAITENSTLNISIVVESETPVSNERSPLPPMGFEGSFWDYKEPKRNTQRIPRLKENLQKLAGHSGL